MILRFASTRCVDSSSPDRPDPSCVRSIRLGRLQALEPTSPGRPVCLLRIRSRSHSIGGGTPGRRQPPRQPPIFLEVRSSPPSCLGPDSVDRVDDHHHSQTLTDTHKLANARIEPPGVRAASKRFHLDCLEADSSAPEKAQNLCVSNLFGLALG